MSLDYKTLSGAKKLKKKNISVVRKTGLATHSGTTAGHESVTSGLAAAARA
jgi:hypothetical protein